MVAVLLLGGAAATSLLLALSCRLGGLAATLVAAYFAWVADLGLTTLVLSPFREVTRLGLGLAELVLLAAAVALWRRRGRPTLPLAGLRERLAALARDPVTLLFVLGIGVLLAYEVALASSPPNNMDSLTYHLTRAAAWAQHGGLYWVPNTPEIEVNAYQPLAELQQLFLFVATGSGAFYALPQFLAQLGVLVAVYLSARRLGFSARPALWSSLVLATFSLVALESVTAQNDLFTASLIAVSGALLLGPGWIEPALGGAAAGLALGAKLTAALVLPVLLALALTRGRRVVASALAGGAVGLVAIGIWGYVLNLIHTGTLLGPTSVVQDRAGPGYPRSLANALDVLYGLMDESVLSNHEIDALAVIGIGLAGALLFWRRRARPSAALVEAASVATPFLAPLLVAAGAALIAAVAAWWGLPIRGPHGILPGLEANLNEQYDRFANEDYSAFGPLGIVALVVSSLLALLAARHAPRRPARLVLASALALFLVLLSLDAVWVPFLIRYFLLPAVLAAPLLALLFRRATTRLAYGVVAAFVVALTITHDQAKQLHNADGYPAPWELSWPAALAENSEQGWGAAFTTYSELVPAHACVGTLVGSDEPTYLLFGPRLEHHLDFLPLADAVGAAQRDRLDYVVLSSEVGPDVGQPFQAAGWRLAPLGANWTLASRTAPATGCG